VELEIACRVGENGIDAWTICAEMPSSGIKDLPDRGVTSLVADRCAAGALILGSPRPIDTISDAPKSGVDLISGGVVLTSGGTDGLTDAPLNIAHVFLTRARELGFEPQKGQWIATGGMTPCVDVSRQGAYSIQNGPSFSLDLP